jgi:inorganic pyrophosphatase/exopolyphosphatase
MGTDYEARVSEILEHHRIGDLRLPEPIVIHCEPVGATATLVGADFKEFRIGDLRLGIAQMDVTGPDALATRKRGRSSVRCRPYARRRNSRRWF